MEYASSQAPQRPTTKCLQEVALPSVNRKTPQQLINMAWRQFEQGRLEKATSFAADALKARPNDFDTLYLMGLINLKKNKHLDARTYFEKSLHIQPRNYFSLFNLANTLMRLSLLDEALQVYDRAIKSNPRFVESHINRGNLLRQQGLDAEALQAFEDALQINTRSVEALLSKGALLAQTGDYENALMCYEDALQETRVPNVLEARGHILLRLGRAQEAVASFSEAVSLEPKNADYHKNLGIARMACDDIAGAQETYRGWQKATPGYRQVAKGVGILDTNGIRSLHLDKLKQFCIGRTASTAAFTGTIENGKDSFAHGHRAQDQGT